MGDAAERVWSKLSSRMALFQAIRAARIVPQAVRPQAAACRLLATPALQEAKPASRPMLNALGEPLSKRHAGVSVLGCAIAMVAVGRSPRRRHGSQPIHEGGLVHVYAYRNGFPGVL